ncbi:MAG TPA: type VI secretion system accessory protein TagJ [Pirellulaceae bacterium]|nr:type VI secretion system accessory protein TagJ [Pirellulaceae bacterium]
MSAEELLRAGDLQGAAAKLKEAVRAKPADPKLRTFLFQLFCIQGEWTRAVAQLAVVAELDPLAIPMAQMYREAIGCEMLRAEIFAGKRSPSIFGDPPAWIGSLVQALPQFAAGKIAAAESLRDQAFEQAPTSIGRVNDTEFEWLADADPRLGPVMEVIVNGRYYWAPLEVIAAIDIDEPEDLRDSVWLPAHFTWSNGGEVVGLIPTRYPGSEANADPLVALARKTLWELSGGLELPVGQRTLTTDAGEFALMDVRRLEFGAAEESTAEAAE